MVKLNRGQRSGVKKPFRLEEIWRIRTRLEIESNLMQLALLIWLLIANLGRATYYVSVR